MEASSAIGGKNNYNFQTGSNYQLWPYSTIKWVPEQNRYLARVIVQDKTTQEMVAFNSWHADYADAKQAIDLVSDSLEGVGERRVYNIFGEVMEVHPADLGGGQVVNVFEVQGLIWSMQQS